MRPLPLGHCWKPALPEAQADRARVAASQPESMWLIAFPDKKEPPEGGPSLGRNATEVAFRFYGALQQKANACMDHHGFVRSGERLAPISRLSKAM